MVSVKRMEPMYSYFLLLSQSFFILVLVSGRFKDVYFMVGDIIKDLVHSQRLVLNSEKVRTRALKFAISSSVIVSALAMIGIRLTFVWSRRMNSISIGFSLEIRSCKKYVFNGSRYDARMTSGLDKVQAGVHTIVDNLLPVHAVFLLQIRVKTRLDVLNDRFPAIQLFSTRIHWWERWTNTHLSSLLTKSPKPGVSTTVKRSRTPFSSISEGPRINYATQRSVLEEAYRH